MGIRPALVPRRVGGGRAAAAAPATASIAAPTAAAAAAASTDGGSGGKGGGAESILAEWLHGVALRSPTGHARVHGPHKVHLGLAHSMCSRRH